jgi:hypothetical protein
MFVQVISGVPTAVGATQAIGDPGKLTTSSAVTSEM